MKNLIKITLIAAAFMVANSAFAQDKAKTKSEGAPVPVRLATEKEKSAVKVKPVTTTGKKAIKLQPVNTKTTKVKKAQVARDVTGKPIQPQKTAISKEDMSKDDKIKKSKCKPGCTMSCCKDKKTHKGCPHNK